MNTARKSGLRLDVRENATAAAESAAIAIVPHDADGSELIKRIASADPDTQMPPASFNKPLSKTQIETLRQWIAEGAILSTALVVRTHYQTGCARIG